MDRILLIDFNNFAWRANVVFKPKKDIPTGYEDTGSLVPPADTIEKPVPPENVIIFNFFRNLRALIEPFSPSKIIYALEGHPAFRYELLPEYKANRIIKTASTPAETKASEAKDRFNKAYPDLLRLSKFLPITQMRHRDYEADDLIGTLVEDLKNEDVIVVSGDSDLVQLLQKGYKTLRLYSPNTKAMVVAPDYHYLTWKCLHGDKRTDNIPGMMGDKTAQKMTKDPEKLKEWLEVEENIAKFNINRQLIELSKVPLEQTEIEDGSLDEERLKIEFDQLDFKTLVKEPYWGKFCLTFRNVSF